MYIVSGNEIQMCNRSTKRFVRGDNGFVSRPPYRFTALWNFHSHGCELQFKLPFKRREVRRLFERCEWRPFGSMKFKLWSSNFESFGMTSDSEVLIENLHFLKFLQKLYWNFMKLFRMLILEIAAERSLLLSSSISLGNLQKLSLSDASQSSVSIITEMELQN